MQAWQSNESIAAGSDFFGRPVVQFILALIILNNCLAFTSSIVGAVISFQSRQRFGTNAAAYMEAIKQIAGQSDFDSISQVTRAIDAFKVAGALKAMDKYLKVQLTAKFVCILSAPCQEYTLSQPNRAAKITAAPCVAAGFAQTPQHGWCESFVSPGTCSYVHARAVTHLQMRHMVAGPFRGAAGSK